MDFNDRFFSFHGGPKVPFEKVAKQVGPGWTPILQKLCEKLFFLGWDGGLAQVKEKFGTLRFYFENNLEGLAAELAYDAVHSAEETSSRVCEACGKYGEARSHGSWLVTECNECYHAWLKDTEPKKEAK